jgi:hypothetical protein
LFSTFFSCFAFLASYHILQISLHIFLSLLKRKPWHRISSCRRSANDMYLSFLLRLKAVAGDTGKKIIFREIFTPNSYSAKVGAYRWLLVCKIYSNFKSGFLVTVNVHLTCCSVSNASGEITCTQFRLVWMVSYSV